MGNRSFKTHIAAYEILFDGLFIFRHSHFESFCVGFTHEELPIHRNFWTVMGLIQTWARPKVDSDFGWNPIIDYN